MLVGFLSSDTNARPWPAAAVSRGAGWILPAAALLLPALPLSAEVWLTWQTTWQQARTELVQSADAGAEYAARTLYGYQVAAGRINDLLRNLSDGDIRAREGELHEAAKAIVSEIPCADGSYVIDRFGYPLLSATVFPLPKVRPDLRDRDFFQALSQPDPPDPHISQLHVGRIEANLFFAVSRRRTEAGNGLPQGSFDGLVNLAMDPATLAEGMRKFLANDTDRMSLIRADRQLLATTGPQYILSTKRLVEMVFTRQTLPAPATTVSVVNGAEQLVTRRWAGDLPVYVAVSRPRAAIVAAWWHQVSMHLIFGIPAMLALFLLALRVRSSQRQLVDANARLHQAWEGSEERLRRTAFGGNVYPFEVAPDGLVTCHDGFRLLFGRRPGTRLDWLALLDLIHPDDRALVIAEHDRLAREGGAFTWEVRTDLAGGEGQWLMVAGEAVAGAGGFPRRMTGIAMNISERKHAELALQQLNRDLEERVRAEIAARELTHAQLMQSQHLKALGQLADGVAHDFDNVLQTVTGGLALIQRRTDDPSSVQRFAQMAAEAAGRGAAITGRLLTFARKGQLRAEAIFVTALLADLREILLATLGRQIEVETVCTPPDLVAWADKAQLQTALVNLAVNARDAMPDGGCLTLMATAEVVADGTLHPAELAPGGYVRLSVIDTGVGMDAATLARAAEPFFTTKGVGQGTGLGLPMVHGFVHQSGGAMAIDSKPGNGTSISVWLPVAGRARQDDRALQAARDGWQAGASARVLLVDDDALVRNVLVVGLKDAGFEVEEAPDGLSALVRLDHGERPDVLVTDFAMPGMTGASLIEEARRRMPNLPVLLMTGYADNRILSAIEFGADPPSAFLRKPVRPDELAQRLRDLLGLRDAVQAAE
ncbi:MAG: response regulator [Acetobacteraceae bacterium]